MLGEIVSDLCTSLYLNQSVAQRFYTQDLGIIHRSFWVFIVRQAMLVANHDPWVAIRR